MKISNKYVWIDYHDYYGPTFWRDSSMTKLYDPKDENGPIWSEFAKWLKKYETKKAKVSAGKGEK